MSAAIVFEGERARLRGLAYRMLGSMADADDVVQEAWLRWDRLGDEGRAAVQQPAAWFTTTVSRLAVDVLRSAHRRRVQYVGPWLPEPILTDAGSPLAALDDPAASAELAESITLGFLTVLERLGPVERAVFLLVDVFGEPYSQAAAVVGRSEEACRQIASRARRRVREERRAPARAEHPDELVAAFMAACAGGSADGLRKVLSEDIVLVSDGGREVRAARRPVVGVARVSRLLLNLTSRLKPDVEIELHSVNGEPGLVFARAGRPWMVMAFEIAADQIVAMRLVLNPEKLREVGTSR